MGILSLDVKVGEAVQLGDVACIAFDFRPPDKFGRQQKDRLKLRIATATPIDIKLIPTGIIPRFFVTGLGARPAERDTEPDRPVLAMPAPAAA